MQCILIFLDAMHFNILRQSGRFLYAYFKIYFYMPNFASIGRVDLVSFLPLARWRRRRQRILPDFIEAAIIYIYWSKAANKIVILCHGTDIIIVFGIVNFKKTSCLEETTHTSCSSCWSNCEPCCLGTGFQPVQTGLSLFTEERFTLQPVNTLSMARMWT